MHPRNLVIVKLLLPCYISIAVVGVCQGQTGLGHATDSATNWKACKLATLDRQLKDEAVNGTSRDELEARRKWLKNWAVGSMTSTPNSDSQLPKFRTEPIMNSDVATKCRQRLNWESTEQDESDVLVLRHAIADRPNDIGLQQLHLHWLDLPVRRKTHLKQINASAIRLINSLKAQDVADPKIRLALEFTLYRRGRALAYRELPDVVKQIPIEDPKWLNKEVLSVYQEMIAAAGNGRPEFILLEIRILRRAKSFGSALSLLEKYGSAIKPQWYLKKRRDLLNELEWEVPYLEAAKIYENEYPAEVAKEKEGSQPAEPKKNSAGKWLIPSILRRTSFDFRPRELSKSSDQLLVLLVFAKPKLHPVPLDQRASVRQYLSVLPPEANVANRDPRSGSSLLLRRASSSRPYHSQTSSTAHPIRPQAAG